MEMQEIWDIMYGTWSEMVSKIITDIRPHLTISDFFSQVGVPAADKLGIPAIINVPGMIEAFSAYGMSGIFDMKRASTCCGCLCYTRKSSQMMYEVINGKFLTKEAYEYYYGWNKRVVLWNTYWGLEPACSIPPNYIITGPLNEPASNLLTKLKEKDSVLFDWMEKALADNQDVVYVSIGSLCKWQQWSVDAIYYGLKNLGCKVVWSMKDFKLPEENPDFYVREWMPQIEVLAHPAMKAGLCHCGFGGILEFTGLGLPIVGWPHFND